MEIYEDEQFNQTAFQNLNNFSEPYGRVNVQDEIANIIQQIDPKHILKRIELSLRGYMIDDRGNPVTRKEYLDMIKESSLKSDKAYPVPLMNNPGIKRLMDICRAYINLNLSLSNNDKFEQIELIEMKLNKDLHQMLMYKSRWDIKNDEDRNVIMQIVFPPIDAVLKRSFKEGDKRFLRKTQQEITTRNIQDIPKKDFLANLFGGKN